MTVMTLERRGRERGPLARPRCARITHARLLCRPSVRPSPRTFAARPSSVGPCASSFGTACHAAEVKYFTAAGGGEGRRRWERRRRRQRATPFLPVSSAAAAAASSSSVAGAVKNAGKRK